MATKQQIQDIINGMAGINVKLEELEKIEKNGEETQKMVEQMQELIQFISQQYESMKNELAENKTRVIEVQEEMKKINMT